jgi:hypothetical protein
VLGVIEAMVDEECRARSIVRSDARFTRRELRRRCGMSNTAVRVHLERLVLMEYVQPLAGRNGARFEYELLFDGDLDTCAPQMIGLIDVKSMTTIGTLQGQTADLAPPWQATGTPLTPPLQGAVLAENSSVYADSGQSCCVEPENTPLGRTGPDRSRNGTLASAPLSSLAALFSAASSKG